MQREWDLNTRSHDMPRQSNDNARSHETQQELSDNARSHEAQRDWDDNARSHETRLERSGPAVAQESDVEPKQTENSEWSDSAQRESQSSLHDEDEVMAERTESREVQGADDASRSNWSESNDPDSCRSNTLVNCPENAAEQQQHAQSRDQHMADDS